MELQKSRHYLHDLMYKRASQSHANDKDRRIKSEEKGPKLWLWQHCCVCKIFKWKKKGTRVAVLSRYSSLVVALRLGRQAFKVALEAWLLGLIYRHFFHRGGGHWIDSFCNFHTTTAHFSTPCHSLSLLIVAKVAWWAGERLEKLLSETEQRER